MSGTLLWLVALAALSLIAAIVLRRMARLAGAARELQRLQADLAGIDQRLATVVDPLVGRLDEVRRGARDPAELGPELEAARAALRSLSREARTLKAPAVLADRLQHLHWELDRVVRAADMTGHGVETMVLDRRMPGSEAQVALKRGTLGLRHGREAITRLVVGVESLTPAELRTMPPNGIGARPGAIVTPPTDEDLLVGGRET